MTRPRQDTDGLVLAWSVLRARGPEAESFLQGQLSQDLERLDSHGGWALVLAPDSAIVAACFVTREEDGFDLVVARGVALAAHQRLSRFLLRTKCALEVAETDRGPFRTLGEQIVARWPGENEFATHLTPHAFGRSFVDATVSFDKGCFTGQELVARLHARGASVPWRFVAVSGPSRERVDLVLKSKGPAGPQGVTSAREVERGIEGLGIAHRTLVGSMAEGNDVGVTVQEID